MRDIQEVWYRVAFGATATRDPGDLERVKKGLHDQVVADLGDDRVGPVRWQWWPAPTGLRILAQEDARPQGDPDHVRGLYRFLRRNPGGYLVVAAAPCRSRGPEVSS